MNVAETVAEIREYFPDIPDCTCLDEILAFIDKQEISTPEISNSVFVGKVFVAKNAFVGQFNLIRGPAYIGNNVVIGAHNEVARSVILHDSKINHRNLVLDTICGSDCQVAAGLIVCNYTMQGAKMGVTIGHRVRIGVNVSLMPGCLIEDDTLVVGPAIVDRKGRIKSLVQS